MTPATAPGAAVPRDLLRHPAFQGLHWKLVGEPAPHLARRRPKCGGNLGTEKNPR
jgi:hypothetical protein